MKPHGSKNTTHADPCRSMQSGSAWVAWVKPPLGGLNPCQETHAQKSLTETHAIPYDFRPWTKQSKTGAKRGAGAEDGLQKTVVTFLARMLPTAAVAWATPNGGSRHRLEAVKLKATGSLAGIPDLFVFYEGKLIGLELKRPPKLLTSGKVSKAKPVVSDAQTDVHARLNRAGAQCFVCRSVGEVEAALKLCGVPLGRRNPHQPPEGASS